MDYRKILIKYIEHVGRCEGTDFLLEEIDGLTVEENIALHEASADGSSTEKYREELKNWIAKLKAKT